MKTYFSVVKRDGSKVPFDISKIKQVIAWACDSTGCNPLILESKISSLFREGITTEAIQANLVLGAVNLTSIQEPHWKDVAGKLMMMDYWKEVRGSRGYGYSDSLLAITSKIDKGIYTSDLKCYSTGDWKEALIWIDPTLDLVYDHAGMSVIANPNRNKRYVFTDELLQEAYLVQAMLIASVEATATRLSLAKEVYYYLSRRKISLATPLWLNLRREGGNLASCFTLEVGDTIDSIFDSVKKVARISAVGGGVGVSLAKVRAAGSWLRDKALAATGSIPFIKIVNDTAVAVNQGGSRAGAVTVALPSWHLDIQDFLEIQSETGDTRKRSFDIFPQVTCSDEFMRRVDANEQWTLVDPHEVRVKYGVDLADLFGFEFETLYKKIEAELVGEIQPPNLTKSEEVSTIVDFQLPNLTKSEEVSTIVDFQLPNLTKSNQKESIVDFQPPNLTKSEEVSTIVDFQPPNLTKSEEVSTIVDFQPPNSTEFTSTPVGANKPSSKANDLFKQAMKSTMGAGLPTNGLTLWKKVNARDLYKQMMKSKIETGLPYEAYVDTINRYNPNRHVGGIKLVNLCVTPDTFVLTDRGSFRIIDLVDQEINVWNGSDWSTTKAFRTGKNQPVLTIGLDNGVTLNTTSLHRFFVKDPAAGPVTMVRAKDLQVGQTLITGAVPNSLVGYAGENVLVDAYSSGANLGELLANPFTTIIDREVPLGDYTLDSLVSWFTGYLHGTKVAISSKNGVPFLQLVSTDLATLLKIRLLLQSLGVDSSVPLLGCSVAKCPAYQLLIHAGYGTALASLGVTSNGPPIDAFFQYQGRPELVEVKVLYKEDNEVSSDVYCFFEPENGMGVFNGTLTGQCNESFSTTVEDQYDHVCSLVSLNLANISLEELGASSGMAVKILDNTLAITVAPTEQSAAHIKAFRTIGIGSMGLHDMLALNNRNYTTGQDLMKVIAETTAFYAFQASAKLAETKGSFELFEGSELSKGFILGKLFHGKEYILVEDIRKHFQFNEVAVLKATQEGSLEALFEPSNYDFDRYPTSLDWTAIRKAVREGIRNSQLIAIAPNTSTSLVQGCTASILPVFSKFFLDKSSKGTTVNCPPYLAERFWYYTENKNIDQALVIEATAIFQTYCDTGISMELLFDLNKDEVDAKYIYDRQLKAWKSGVKAIYYVRSLAKQKDPDRECSSCAG